MRLAKHQATGGFQALRKALTMQPAALIDEVKKASIRGRGGAGFPAGTKWSFLPKDNPRPRYLVINADEGEPGTFKDRYFLEQDPFALLEGIAISAYAIGARAAYLYVRGEFVKPMRILNDAIDRMRMAGVLGRSVLGA